MNNFSGTLIDGLQTLRESRIENRKMEDITKIRHVLAADCSPMNVGNDLDSPLLSKSDSDQEHSVLQSSTPTRQVRTYSISFKVRTLKLSLYFPAKCMIWLPVVIGSLQKKTTYSRQYQKHLSSTVQNMELVFFSVDVPCTLWAEKRPRAAVKITQRCFTAHFKSRK